MEVEADPTRPISEFANAFLFQFADFRNLRCAPFKDPRVIQLEIRNEQVHNHRVLKTWFEQFRACVRVCLFGTY